MLEHGRQTTTEPAEVNDRASETPPPPVPARMQNTSLRVIALCAVILLLRYAQAFFVPIVFSVLISYALNPAVNWTTRWKIPRALGSAIVLLVLTCGLLAGVYSLRGQATAALESLPEGAQKLRAAFRRDIGALPGTTAMDKIREAAEEIDKTAAEAAGVQAPQQRGVTRVQVQQPAFSANTYLWSGSIGFIGLMAQAVLVFFLVYFLLASGDFYKRTLVKIVGHKLAEKRITVEILQEINSQIGWFLLVQLLTSVLVAIVTGLALWMVGLNQPAVWGVAAGVFNSIPYFGPLIVTIGLTAVAFLQFGTIGMAVYVAGIALLITTLEGFLLTPALMGKAARMNQVAIFVGLLFWTWIWGILGIILAVPIMMAVKTLCDHVEGLQPIADLLGEGKVALKQP